jgi:hypothetical protein
MGPGAALLRTYFLAPEVPVIAIRGLLLADLGVPAPTQDPWWTPSPFPMGLQVSRSGRTETTMEGALINV